MKKLFALLLSFSFLTGCGMADRNNILNLLSSPKLSERESRIVMALNEYLGGDIVLKYPKRGDSASPVQITDLNGDGRDEAVVLYTEPAYGSYVHIAILTQENGEWEVRYETEGYGTEIYRISFENITSSREKEIVAGYTFSDSREKILSVYFIKDGKSEYEYVQTCQDYVIHDLTGDGAGDIVLAGINAYNQHTQVKVISAHHSGDSLETLAAKQIEIRNAMVNNIAFTKSDFADGDSIIIDYQDTGRRVYTEALSFDGENLNVILEPDVVQKIWYFDYELNSRDVDKDGYFETPTVIDDGSRRTFALKQMEWTCFLKENPQRKYYGVCEADRGVFFPLPDEWQNHIVLSGNEENNSWQVIQNSTGDVLVDFQIVTAADEKQNESGGIIVGKGTVQVKITFAPQVTPAQREYIANGLMDIR